MTSCMGVIPLFSILLNTSSDLFFYLLPTSTFIFNCASLVSLSTSTFVKLASVLFGGGVEVTISGSFSLVGVYLGFLD